MPVRVRFLGVCTHVRKDEQFTPWLAVPHRVVLLEARQEKSVGKHRIPRHGSIVRVGGRTESIEHGVTVTIAHGDQPLLYDRSYFERVPRLRDYAPELAASEPIVTGKDDRRVDAYFDIRGGTLRAGCVAESVGVELVIDDASKLILTDWNGGRVIEIDLEENAVVWVEHMAASHGPDDTNHFLLHYGISGGPAEPAEPFTDRCSGPPLYDEDVPPGLDVSIGPGCSDSDYP